MKEAANPGRSLVTVGRFARRHWALHGLHDRRGKSSRLGPETVDEVQPVLVPKLGSATVLCGDGAKAWAATARACEKPLLKGVRHGQRIFTRVSSLNKGQLDSGTKRFLEKSARGKSHAVASYQRKFVAACGDNIAEGGF